MSLKQDVPLLGVEAARSCLLGTIPEIPSYSASHFYIKSSMVVSGSNDGLWRRGCQQEWLQGHAFRKGQVSEV